MNNPFSRTLAIMAAALVLALYTKGHWVVSFDTEPYWGVTLK